ncbi:hypothetical protein ABK040_014574 [Willaertia magna]
MVNEIGAIQEHVRSIMNANSSTNPNNGVQYLTDSNISNILVTIPQRAEEFPSQQKNETNKDGTTNNTSNQNPEDANKQALEGNTTTSPATKPTFFSKFQTFLDDYIFGANHTKKRGVYGFIYHWIFEKKFFWIFLTILSAIIILIIGIALAYTSGRKNVESNENIRVRTLMEPLEQVLRRYMLAINFFAKHPYLSNYVCQALNVNPTTNQTYWLVKYYTERAQVEQEFYYFMKNHINSTLQIRFVNHWGDEKARVDNNIFAGSKRKRSLAPNNFANTAVEDIYNSSSIIIVQSYDNVENTTFFADYKKGLADSRAHFSKWSIFTSYDNFHWGDLETNDGSGKDNDISYSEAKSKIQPATFVQRTVYCDKGIYGTLPAGFVMITIKLSSILDEIRQRASKYTFLVNEDGHYLMNTFETYKEWEHILRNGSTSFINDWGTYLYQLLSSKNDKNFTSVTDDATSERSSVSQAISSFEGALTTSLVTFFARQISTDSDTYYLLVGNDPFTIIVSGFNVILIAVGIMFAFILLMSILFAIQRNKLSRDLTHSKETIKVLKKKNLEIEKQRHYFENAYLSTIPGDMATRLLMGEKFVADDIPDLVMITIDLEDLSNAMKQLNSHRLFIRYSSIVFKIFEELASYHQLHMIGTDSSSFSACRGIMLDEGNSVVSILKFALAVNYLFQNFRSVKLDVALAQEKKPEEDIKQTIPNAVVSDSNLDKKGLITSTGTTISLNSPLQPLDGVPTLSSATLSSTSSETDMMATQSTYKTPAISTTIHIGSAICGVPDGKVPYLHVFGPLVNEIEQLHSKCELIEEEYKRKDGSGTNRIYLSDVLLKQVLATAPDDVLKILGYGKIRKLETVDIELEVEKSKKKKKTKSDFTSDSEQEISLVENDNLTATTPTTLQQTDDEEDDEFEVTKVNQTVHIVAPQLHLVDQQGEEFKEFFIPKGMLDTYFTSIDTNIEFF